MDYKHKKTDKKGLENDYIIVYEGKAFAMHFDLHVHRIKSYYSIGAGRAIGDAAMYLGHGPKKAIEVACDISLYCHLPVKSFKHEY